MSTEVVVDKDVKVVITTEEALNVISVEETKLIIEDGSDNTVVVETDHPHIISTIEQGPPGPPGPQGASGGEEEMPYDIIVDEFNSEGDMYVGQSDPGTATSASNWRIYRVDLTGGYLEKRYANNSADFDKVWNNRTSYVYS